MPIVPSKYLGWDDLKLDMEFPEITYLVTRKDIETMAYANEDSNPMYWDDKFAQQTGLNSIATPFYFGPDNHFTFLKAIGVTLSCYTAHSRDIRESFLPIHSGDLLKLTMNLANKYEKNGKKYITWHIQIINQKDEKVMERLRTSWWTDREVVSPNEV